MSKTFSVNVAGTKAPANASVSSAAAFNVQGSATASEFPSQDPRRFARAIKSLRFEPALEEAFREAYLEQNNPRARFTTTLFFALFLVLAVTNGLGMFLRTSGIAPEPMQLLQLALTFPALVLLLSAAWIRSLKKHYQIVASTAVAALGLSVMATSGLTAAAGSPPFQMLGVLLIVYASLFAGLIFCAAAPIVGALLISFFVSGIAFGVPVSELALPGTVLSVTAFMALGSAAQFERLMRTQFIENRWLNEIAETDPLTGLRNRRGFDNLVKKLWQQADRDQQRLQIILIDIDYFKQFNDLYGHQAGDVCIQRIARVIAHLARRPLDVCARYGGEEFVLAIYGSTAHSAQALAETYRREVMAEAMRHEGSDVARVVTVSVGSAAARPDSGRSLDRLIQSADEALYHVKRSGRNRAVHRDVATADSETSRFAVLMTG